VVGGSPADTVPDCVKRHAAWGAATAVAMGLKHRCKLSVTLLLQLQIALAERENQTQEYQVCGLLAHAQFTADEWDGSGMDFSGVWFC
jgi:hypothetical protein